MQQLFTFNFPTTDLNVEIDKQTGRVFVSFSDALAEEFQPRLEDKFAERYQHHFGNQGMDELHAALHTAIQKRLITQYMTIKPEQM